MKLKLYRYNGGDCGRMGVIESLCLMTTEQVNWLTGQYVYLDEPLGKHSEIRLDFEDGEWEVLNDNPIVIDALLEIFPDKLLSGFNLYEYTKEQASERADEDE